MSSRKKVKGRSRSPSPWRHRRGRSRSRSREHLRSRRRQASTDSESDHHRHSKKSSKYYSSSSDSNVSYSHHGNSTGRSRKRKKRRRRERERSRSRTPQKARAKERNERPPSREVKSKSRRRRRSTSSSQSRSGSRSQSRDTNQEISGSISTEVSGAGTEVGGTHIKTPAEKLRERMKALLEKASTAAEPSVVSESHDQLAPPTPGQMALLESNSFVSDKFVSSRKSRKWDVPPSDLSPAVRAKKPALVKGPSDVGTVDPSEYVPKVVPLSEVEGAMQRGGGGEGGGGEEVVEGEEGVCGEAIAKQEGNKISESTAETQPLNKDQRWLHKLLQMRKKFVTPPSD